MKLVSKVIAAIALLTSFSSFAGLVYQNQSYTYFEADNGLEWVYASPCAGVGGCGQDVTLIDGFRFANDQEWFGSFTDLAGLIAAFDLTNYNANVCASAYFGSGYSHCDSSDVISGYVWHSPVAWNGSKVTNGAAETFLVRGVQQQVSVPEPAGIAVLALTLLGLAVRYKRQA